jgi:hypothetical protein
MIAEIINHTQIIVPVVGIAVFVIIGAIVWAGIAIYKFIDREYVEKIECEKCRSNLKDECKKTVDDTREDLSKDIKDLDKKLDQWISTGVRIETKVDMLLNGFKKE